MRSKVRYLLPFFFFLSLGQLIGRTLHVPSEYSTIESALNSSMSNDTILIQPGLYYEGAETDGTGKAGVVIMGVSKETTVISAADPTLVSVPNTFWEVVSANVWRTPYSHNIGDFPSATIKDTILLFTYPSLQNFNEKYAGSGVFYDISGGYLYVYLKNGENPNLESIYVSRELTPLYLKNCQGWTVKNLSLKYGARANLFTRYNCNSITLDSLNLLNCRNGILHWSASTNYTVRNCDIRANYDPLWSWQEIKNPPNGAEKTMEGAGIRTEYVLNSDLYNNNIQGYFDGIALTNQLSHGNINNRVYNNIIHDIYDDAVSLDFGGRGTEVYSNIIYNTFVGISMAPFEGGPHYIYRNVIVSDKEILWDDSGGQDRRYGYVFKLGGRAAPTYNPEIKCENAKIYHNTFIGYRAVVQFAANNDLWWDFEFYNNIFYSRLLYPIRDSGIHEEGNKFDGNLYFRFSHQYLIRRWNDVTDGNYSTLLEAKNSPRGLLSGWEEHGIEGDPLFMGIIPPVSNGSLPITNLQMTSPAINSGIQIDTTFPDVFEILDGMPDIGAIEYSTTSIENQGAYINSFTLLQNYPNPFNPTTKIKFDIPKSGIVKLVIYDILGREVSRLVNTKLTAGRYEMEWNAGGYASGMYFYRLETDGFVQTKKMMLVK